MIRSISILLRLNICTPGSAPDPTLGKRALVLLYLLLTLVVTVFETNPVIAVLVPQLVAMITSYKSLHIGVSIAELVLAEISKTNAESISRPK